MGLKNCKAGPRLALQQMLQRYPSVYCSLRTAEKSKNKEENV